MSTKPNFNRAQNEATKLLLSQKISSLFIDVRKFSFDRKIIIDSVQHYAHVLHRPISNFVCDEFSGCCVIPHPRCNLVLYDDRETNECPYGIIRTNRKTLAAQRVDWFVLILFPPIFPQKVGITRVAKK